MRKETANRYTRKCIVWAVTMMITAVSIIAPVQSAYAEDTQTTEQTQIDSAQTAVSAAQAAVDKAQSAVEVASDKVDSAEQAADNAQKTANAVSDNVSDAISNYNSNVAAAQQAVNTASDDAASLAKAAGTTSNDAIKAQADIAKVSADYAKKELENALSVNTVSANEEVKQHVDNVIKAAESAKAAEKTAEDIYSAALNQLKNCIIVYNNYAYAYGLTAYTFTDKDGKQSTPGYEAVAGVVPDPLVNLTMQKKVIDNAASSVSAAEADYDKASAAAVSADRIVDEMNKAVPSASALSADAAKVISDNNANDNKLNTVKTNLATVSSNLAGELEKYNEAYAQLKKLQDSNSAKLSTLQLSDLQKAIDAAQTALKTAAKSLKDAQKANSKAQSYAGWATALVTQQTTGAFSQAVVISGNKTYSYANSLSFDMADSSVVSRGTQYFITLNANGKKGTEVEVPYSIYRAYVAAMYNKYTYLPNGGKGISAEADGTMPVIYWGVSVNSAGKYYLTGESYTSLDAQPDGIYFVGYTFKHESDGYHIDGVMMTKTTPEVPVNPSPSPSTPSETPTTTTAATTSTAATGAVLGARRAPSAITSAVLGARRSPSAVLGARTGAATGDDSDMSLWLLVMAASALIASAAFSKRRRMAD